MTQQLKAEFWQYPDVSAGQPLFSNGVRLVDAVDRVLAGDDLEEVAEDFGVAPEEIEMALRVFAAAAGRVSKSYHYLRRSSQPNPSSEEGS